MLTGDGMLSLQRRRGERLVYEIPPQTETVLIEVEVVGGISHTKLGTIAPRCVRVDRKEVRDAREAGEPVPVRAAGKQ